MADDAYYRQVLTQMQSEFRRAVAALEKQVAALTRHNELLTGELAQTKQQQSEWAQEATQTVTQLQRQLETQVADAAEAQREAADREQALAFEISALKNLLQQEQDYWTRYDQAGKEDRDRLTKQLAETKAEAMQHHEQNRTLRREIKALQDRVETAVATSNSFEQRLMVVVREKQQSIQEAENQLARYKKKVHEKRAQNKYLTEALVRLQEQRQSADSSSSQGSPTTTGSSRSTRMTRITETPSLRMETVTKPVDVPAQSIQRRVRKRELTLPEEIKAAATNVTTSSRMYKSKRLGSSRAGTSPTSSSPEISPRSARSAPYKRAPSVATTTPTASDGNSFNSNSSTGSARSMRSLHNVTGRRISSRSSSDIDNIDVSARTNVGNHRGTSPTGRLERELSGLRRKLDSCIADTGARW